MFQRFKRVVEWKRSKRKKRNSLTADHPHPPGTQSVPSLTRKSELTSQGMTDPILSSSPTLNAPIEHRSAIESVHPQPPAPSTMGSIPPYLASQTTTKSASNNGPDSSSNELKSRLNKPTLIIRSMKAVLTILGELAGAPTVASFTESLDKHERDFSTRKGVEEQCDALLKTIESVKEVSNVPQMLRDNLQELRSTLTVIHEEICDHKVPVDVEGIARGITDRLQLFLFKSYLGGLVTRPDLYDRLEKHTLSQAIRELPRAKAAYNDYTKDKRRVACFEGTRQALLQEIARWLSAWDDSRAYLLFGIAGIGKSTVAQTVAERADNLGRLGASFFFSRDEADRRTAERFFTTLAFQLCVYDEEFARAIGRALTEERGAAATTKEPLEQLRALIVEPLRNADKSRPWPIAIVVDALDECNAEDGPLILMGLDQLVRELPFFKVILTTRPQPHLQYLLERLGEHKIFHLQNIEETVVDGDIRLYLGHCFSHEEVTKRVPNLRRRWDVNDQEIDVLVQMAGRLFIIASTTVLFVLDTAVRNPASRMQKLQEEFTRNRSPFNSLNDFYTVILRSAVPLGCDRDVVERYQAVVGAIVLIEDPLPVSALANLIGMQDDDIYGVLDNLQSIVSLEANAVPLVYHKSFPDYVTDDKRCKDVDLCIIPRAHHTQLATHCLGMMNAHLKRNILGLGDPAQFFNNDEALEEEHISEDILQRVIPSELQYACIHWAKHVAQADLEDSGLAAALRTFTEDHVLHWLEALSWIRKLNTVLSSLGVASKLQTIDSTMRQIFSEALRFVSNNVERIEQSALHLYHSSLPFVPTESLLYKAYQHEIPFCQVGGGRAQWDIQINMRYHQGGSIIHVAFGKDSSQYASWDEECVWLWDSASGIRIKSFQGSQIQLAADFSVLAVPQDSSVTMYSVSSSAPIASFNHPTKVVKIAISFDGSRLAVGLQNGTIRVWHAAKGVPIADLDDYDGSQLAYSPSGYKLAFMSKGGVSLWSGVDAIARLRHELESPVKFIFSADSTRLATLAQMDNAYSLRLWNGRGDLIAVAQDVGEAFTISADGSLAATGGQHKEVQLWSGGSLALVDTIDITQVRGLALSGDMLAVALSDSSLPYSATLYDIKNRTPFGRLRLYDCACLAFSPDGTRLAGGNLRGAVFVWDVPSIRASAPISETQYNHVTALAFSPDCSRLASGHRDGTIELWDTACMKQIIAHHNLHSSWITSFAFVPDGKKLASGSWDKGVRFWDGSNGQPIGILEHSFSDKLTSLAFSSRVLAAATENAITLWDRTSLDFIYVFGQGADTLSFSLDDSVLVSSRYRNSRSEVTVLDPEKFTVTATVTINEEVTMLFPSPDGSTLACMSGRFEVAGFTLINIVNEEVISAPGNKDLSWVPHLNGIPISLCEHGNVAGRFSARHDRVPVLYIPREYSPHVFASQSSMFALGRPDGRIFLIKSRTTC